MANFLRSLPGVAKRVPLAGPRLGSYVGDRIEHVGDRMECIESRSDPAATTQAAQLAPGRTASRQLQFSPPFHPDLGRSSRQSQPSYLSGRTG
jgi:hypothetical protein